MGQLSEDAVFYLRSRGIPDRAARDLLTYAFASEMVGLLHLQSFRTHVQKLVGSRLGGVGAA